MASSQKNNVSSISGCRRRSGGTVCCVPGCKNNSARDRHVSFHGFPADKSLREEWIRRIGRPSYWQPSRYHKICGAHFNICGKKTYEDRVPTIFPPRPSYPEDEAEFAKQKKKHQTETSEHCADILMTEDDDSNIFRNNDDNILSATNKNSPIKLFKSLNIPGKTLSSDIIESLFGEPCNSTAYNFLTDSSKLFGETEMDNKTYPSFWTEPEPSCETSVEVELSTTDDISNGVDHQSGKRNELDFLRNMLIDHMQTITEQAMEIDRLKKTLLIRPSIEEVILLRIELAKQQQLRKDMEKRLTSQSVKITALTENIHMLEERLEKVNKKGRNICFKYEDKKTFLDNMH